MAGEGYRRQVGVGGPAGLPQASPADFGAGVGAAVAQAGGAMHESEIRAYQIQRRFDADQQNADFAKRFSETRLKLSEARLAARATAGPGAAGHEQAMASQFDQATQGLTDGITDDHERRAADAQLQSYRSSYLEGEAGFEVSQRAAKVVNDVGDLKALTSAEIRTGGNYADVGKHWDQAIDSLQNVDAETREKLRREGHADHALAHIGWGIDSNPEGARAAILSGVYNGDLDGAQIDRALGQADAAIRMRDAAARAQAAQAKQEAREQLQTKKAELDTGAGKPSDWADLATNYEKIGDTSAAVEARAKGVEMQTGLAYRGSTLPQMDARVAELTAKQQGKGLSTVEASELKGLQSLRSQTDTRLNQPGGALLQQQFATGKTPSPVDLNNPATLQRRAQEAIAAGTRYGRGTIEPLLPNELKPLQDMLGGTAAEKLQALDVIAGFGDPRAVRGAARQIAGDNGAFRIAATFIGGPAGHAMARDILNGPDALKANAGIWQQADARAMFAEYQGPLLGMGPEYTADTFEAAKAIYASQMKATGASAWSKDAFRRSIEAAMGGVRAGQDYKGGTASINGARVMIPNGWTADGVARRIARMTGEDLGAARASGPGKWPDGSPIYTGQLRQMVPVYLGGTRYGFRSPQSNRLLPAEGGGPFTLDVAKVPWR